MRILRRFIEPLYALRLFTSNEVAYFSGSLGSNRPYRLSSVAIQLQAVFTIALAVTVWAARTNRRWLLPVAMLFANPVLTSNALVILAAIPRIRAMERPD